MKRVLVLMSAYNGEKYLKEQIESLLCQEGVEVHLLVRDDGSTDQTMEILKTYKDIEIIKGINIGVTGSYLELIRLAGDYEYYAFADQDDVWDGDKLKTAVDKLEAYDGPAIYSGNTRLVDSSLKFLKNETLRPLPTLGSALVKNYVTGCTAVFNVELMRRLKQYRPQHAPFHDWWANVLCLSVGGISVYDETPHMNYRQHGNNAVGGNGSIWKKWASRLHKFFRVKYRRDLMAGEILENYAVQIPSNNREVLEAMKKGRYVSAMTTGNRLDDLLYCICVIFGRI